jgi:CspA family cold shock protein
MRIRGTVKWFNDTKGYGFLRRDDGQSDCFVHHSDIQGEGYRSLQEGEKVEFDVIQQPKGPKASNVVKITDLGDTTEASAEAPAPAPAPEPAQSQPAEAPVATFGSFFGSEETPSPEGASEEE